MVVGIAHCAMAAGSISLTGPPLHTSVALGDEGSWHWSVRQDDGLDRWQVHQHLQWRIRRNDTC